MVTTRSMAKRKQIKNNITKRSTKKIKTKECFIRINRLTVEEILKCTAPMKSTAKTQQEKKIENTTPASSSVLPVIVNKKAVVRKTTTTTISKSSVQSPVFLWKFAKKEHGNAAIPINSIVVAKMNTYKWRIIIRHGQQN